MFDGLFKPKFYTKCKALVKITKTRVDTVKRKKISVCKYLKNDIVDLLKNNLDYNAYGRAEGLVEEKRRLSCYEQLDQFCDCVTSNVSLLHKSSKCPDECREAISSLIYAAARVSEVPELRDLRSLFTERYNNSLDQYVNLEFVERFKAEPPSKEMKVEVLQEMAREYSIKWDAKTLEKRIYTSSSPPPQSWNASESMSSPMRRSESSVSVDAAESKTLYNRLIMPKIEKQGSLPAEKITKCDFMAQDTADSGGRPKPRSVRRRVANPTESLQAKPCNVVPDFEEVAARVDALSSRT
ncbi:unnamed protein product [Cochlearia groenlandica]